MNVVSNQPARDLLTLAKPYLLNEQLFVVRRFVQRFESCEISAKKAMARIREHLAVPDGALFSENESIR